MQFLSNADQAVIPGKINETSTKLSASCQHNDKFQMKSNIINLNLGKSVSSFYTHCWDSMKLNVVLPRCRTKSGLHLRSTHSLVKRTLNKIVFFVDLIFITFFSFFSSQPSSSSWYQLWNRQIHLGQLCADFAKDTLSPSICNCMATGVYSYAGENVLPNQHH